VKSTQSSKGFWKILYKVHIIINYMATQKNTKKRARFYFGNPSKMNS